MTIFEDELRVREPCSVPWETMHEVRGGRHCEQCEHTVRDVSLMTEREVRALIEERKHRRVCIRMRVYEDGTVHTAPAPLVSVSSVLRRVRPLVFAASAALAPACVEESALSTFEQDGDGGYEDGSEAGYEDAGDAGQDEVEQIPPSREREARLDTGEPIRVPHETPDVGAADPYLIPFDVLVVLTASARRSLVLPETSAVTAMRSLAESAASHAPQRSDAEYDAERRMRYWSTVGF